MVQSGGTTGHSSLPGAVVTVYQITETEPQPIGTGTSQLAGDFSIEVSPVAADGSLYYATATLASVLSNK